MKQRTLAAQSGFERYTKKTRRAEFLEEMEQVVPWAELWCADRAGVSEGGAGASAGGVERMLRMYFLQQWFNLSDRRWKKRCMSRCRCGDLWTSIWGASRCRTRRRCASSALTGAASVGGTHLRAGAGALTRAGAADRDGNDRGCDDCARSEFDQERAPGARSGDAPDAQGEAVVLRDEGACGRG